MCLKQKKIIKFEPRIKNKLNHNKFIQVMYVTYSYLFSWDLISMIFTINDEIKDPQNSVLTSENQ